MITKDQKDTAQWAMEYALKQDCQSARVSLITAESNSFEYRNKQLDLLEQCAENKLYIELFINGKYGSFSTNRIERNELERFIIDGIESTDYLAPDTCRQLPDPNRYYKNDGKDLELFDPSLFNISTDTKLEWARQNIEEIYGSDDQIISIQSSYSDGASAEYMVASNGFEGESSGTWCNLSASVALKTGGDARAEASWYDNAVFLNDLQKEGIAKIALDRAKRKIGQTKIASGIYDIILDNTSSARLLSPLISAMQGSSLQQKNSFLLDKIGKKISSDILTIKDTPHIKKAFGSQLYDSEGVATSERYLIKEGILDTYFINTYNALKMGVEPTISAPSIISPQLGNHDFNTMLKSMAKGIWITGFNGGNCNSTTGDYSFGVEGFLIEKGMVGQPINEMNITGNILDLWANLIEIGNDPRLNSSWRIPALIFKNVDFSGF